MCFFPSKFQDPSHLFNLISSYFVFRLFAFTPYQFTAFFFLSIFPPLVFAYFYSSEPVKEEVMKDCHIPFATLPSFAGTHRLQLPEGVNKLKPASDLTPIPDILKPQHHAADEEPDQS